MANSGIPKTKISHLGYCENPWTIWTPIPKLSVQSANTINAPVDSMPDTNRRRNEIQSIFVALAQAKVGLVHEKEKITDVVIANGTRKETAGRLHIARGK